MRFLYASRPSAVDFLWRLAPSWPAMKSAFRFVRRPLQRAHRQPLAGDVPTPAEVLGEIGLILALHLAAAAAVTLTLLAFGI
jgi:hypothetical protein